MTKNTPGGMSQARARFICRKTAPGVRGGTVQRKNRTDVEVHVNDAGPVRIRTEVPRWPNRHLLREEDIRKFIGILPKWEELSRGLDEVVLADQDNDYVDGWYMSGTVAICAWSDSFDVTWPVEHYEEHRELLGRLGVPCEPELDYLCKLPSSYGAKLDKRRSKEVMLELPFEHDDDLGVDVVKSSQEWALKNKHGITVYSVVASPQGIDLYDVGFKCRFQEATARAYLLLHIFLHELGHHHDYIAPPYRGWIVRGEEYAEQYANKYGQQIWEQYFVTFPQE